MKSTTANSATTSSTPVRLHFDDGRRIQEEGGAAKSNIRSSNHARRGVLDCSSNSSTNSCTTRRVVDIDTYYEIQETCQSIVTGLNLVQKVILQKEQNNSDDCFLCRVALQFPDLLLLDSADVCWKMEQCILNMVSDEKFSSLLVPLIFVLGDTTFGSCCVDTVAAQHLRADWVVHYGPACLTPPCSNIPISYVFGRSANVLNLGTCVNDVFLQLQDNDTNEKQQQLIILYDTVYSHLMKDLQTMLNERCADSKSDLKFVIGQIPHYPAKKNTTNTATTKNTQPENLLPPSSCCSGGSSNKTDSVNDSCCTVKSVGCTSPSTTTTTTWSNADVSAINNSTTVSTMVSTHNTNEHQDCDVISPLVIGGLHIRLEPNESIENCILLYIGGGDDDDNDDAATAHLTNVLLRCSASTHSPRECWIYNPVLQTLITDATNNKLSCVKRQIQQRYFQIQKAKVAHIFGIVVATLTIDRFPLVISTIEKILDGRCYYTLAVGKINASKLANFSEIDCFVLVACPDLLLSHNPKDFHAPIVTPFELAIALGYKEWDGFYSLDFSDFLSCCENNDDDDDVAVVDNKKNKKKMLAGEVLEEESSDDDEPYFDITTGRVICLKELRQQRTTATIISQEDLLLQLPGQGQVAKYSSAAAEVWRKREYQGLQSNIGQSKVAPAMPGKLGIASDYGEQE